MESATKGRGEKEEGGDGRRGRANVCANARWRGKRENDGPRRGDQETERLGS